ncbi:exosortase-dependent surface protein XDP1 [Rheinheimera maricola]|uniref:PEP-CTERM sorting domain-containing protein n=1 Tax=Rheinheimera maricola TaxID=2793282 RepID=A0ABS7X7Z7_9GAMM|nr:exosortase-dependent surface protein XDP1 [Rheinheimera maricola]MBZ9611285.1 PEP-CTERM sorting domain-containing protein [Rheinheimera maricola]
MEKLLIACSLLALSGASQAATQTWDFTNGSSAHNMNRNIVPNSINLSDNDNSMSVTMTSWSAYNDENIYQSELWLSMWGTLVFNANGEAHWTDNVGRYDFVLLAFDQDVELAGLNITNAMTGSDVSIAAFNSNPFQGGSAMSRWQQVSDYALASSSFSNVGTSPLNQYYSLNSGVSAGQATTGVKASYWLVGAYNHYFGSGLTAGNDNMKFGGITTKTTSTTQVSAPATLSLFALGLVAFASRRRLK